MKNRSKILLALLIVLTLMVGMFAITASADGTKTYYLDPGPWNKDGAKFVAYFWKDGAGNTFAEMVDTDGDGKFECTVSSVYTKVIFLRKSTNSLDWNNEWNRVGDITIPTNGNNLCTVTGWSNTNYKWSSYTPPVCEHNYNEVGKCTLCGTGYTYTIAGTGSHLGTEWDVANTANDMTFDATTKVYTKVYTNVAAGTYEFKCAQDHAWNVAYPPNNYVLNVAVSGSTITITFDANTNTVAVNTVSPVAQVGDNYFFNLQDAIDAAVDGDTVTLHADFTGDLYITRAADVDVTINGNGKTINGSITIDGKSATYATGSLTIENVNFDATGISKAASINFGVSGNNNTRYITNVSVIKCTFTGGGREKAAIKSYTGGDKNIVVAGCYVDNTMHSLLQVTNVAGLEIDACTVNSKNGINLNNSSDVVVKNSTIEVSGYALRAGAGSDGASGSVELTNNTLKTDNSEGDPVIVIRGLAQKNIDLVMTENVVSGNVHIGGTTADTKVSAEANYWGGVAPVISGTHFDILKAYLNADMTDLVYISLPGQGTEANPFLINNFEELLWFAEQVNSGNSFSKKYVKLNADFDLENNAWTPIGTKAASFQGYFNGDNHTISNLYINDAELSYAGFFGYATNAKIENLNVKNVNINAYSNVGGIAGTVHTGSVTNCHVSGSINLVASYAYAAGIVSDGYVKIYDCSVIANGMGTIYVGEKTMAGGISGWLGEGANGVYNCTVKNLNITAWTSVGAITGLVHYNNTITGCVVENVNLTKTRVNGQAAIGLAAGNWSNKADDNYTITITDNSFTNVTMTGIAINNTNVLYGSNYSYYNKVIKLVESGNTYNKITNNVRLEVTNETDLRTAIINNLSGDVINLGADFSITNALEISGNTITLNLNKHTLAFDIPQTFALRSSVVAVVLSDNATLIIEGNGTVLTNGAVFSVEEGSDVQITGGTFDADVSEYAADGYRVSTALQADGTVLYGVVTNDAKTFIGSNGNWHVGEYDTGVAAQPTVEIIDGYWYLNGINTGYIATPVDTVTPEIKVIDGVWHIDIKDGNGFQSTSVVAGAVDGNGIVSIEKTATEGLIDIYTITYNDGTTTMFTIQHGSNGANGATGPIGAPGNQGPKGDRGEPGANGASNTWLVNSALYIALGCIALAGGVVLVLNYKRTHWWG